MADFVCLFQFARVDQLRADVANAGLPAASCGLQGKNYRRHYVEYYFQHHVHSDDFHRYQNVQRNESEQSFSHRLRDCYCRGMD